MRFRTWLAMGIGAAAGAAATYLLDPDHGEKRRREAAELAREKAEEFDLDKRTQFYAGQVKGSFVEAAKSASPTTRSYDPKTLIRKVESEVLGHSAVDSGQVVVDADPEGVVTLRGQVGSQRLIDDLVERTRVLEGVKDVHNLLHLPSDAPPNTPVGADTAGNGHG